LFTVLHDLKYCRLPLVALVMAVLFLAQGASGATGEAEIGGMNLEARLVFASNTPVASPSARKLDAGSAKRLSTAFLWTNYFLIATQRFSVAPRATRKVVMSAFCYVLVRNLGGGRLDCKLFLDGKVFASQTSILAGGGRVDFGGDATDNNAWFVCLRPPVEEMSAPRGANRAAR
jgi:hypothetical protein